MNFSDFGVKDESELEQDEFSLSRPTFGKENQLTVIGWKGRSGTNKYYIVKCSECSKDPELFGYGIFKGLKGNFFMGNLPCGCSQITKWSEAQFKILIERKCKEKGYIFHSFVEDFKGSYTKLRLECNQHGSWATTAITNFLRGCGCPKCGRVVTEAAITKDDSIHINEFMSTGKFKEGTKFWRSERLDLRRRKDYWSYTCPVCSNDGYVKAGVCSGVFEGQKGLLSSGSVSCRCSPAYHWTKEQSEYQIKKKMQESRTTDEFVGFVDGFKNNRSKFTRNCKLHGEYKTSVNSYLSGNAQCPQCANMTQQECYINFIKDNGNLIALKFGISKHSNLRVKQHNSKTLFNVEQHGVWYFPTIKSCKEAEKFIKQNLKCKILTKEQMPDGYTETTSVENLETIIKIYEDFGGVREFKNDG